MFMKFLIPTLLFVAVNFSSAFAAGINNGFFVNFNKMTAEDCKIVLPELQVINQEFSNHLLARKALTMVQEKCSGQQVTEKISGYAGATYGWSPLLVEVIDGQLEFRYKLGPMYCEGNPKNFVNAYDEFSRLPLAQKRSKLMQNRAQIFALEKLDDPVFYVQSVISDAVLSCMANRLLDYQLEMTGEELRAELLGVASKIVEKRQPN